MALVLEEEEEREALVVVVVVVLREKEAFLRVEGGGVDGQKRKRGWLLCCWIRTDERGGAKSES